MRRKERIAEGFAQAIEHAGRRAQRQPEVLGRARELARLREVAQELELRARDRIGCIDIGAIASRHRLFRKEVRARFLFLCGRRDARSRTPTTKTGSASNRRFEAPPISSYLQLKSVLFG